MHRKEHDICQCGNNLPGIFTIGDLIMLNRIKALKEKNYVLLPI